jgi:hypothetical protein
METGLKWLVARYPLDRVIAYGGIALGLSVAALFATFGFYAQLGIPATLVLASMIYMTHSGYLTQAGNSAVICDIASETEGASEWKKILPTGIVAAVSLAVIWASADALQRPVWVFFALSLVAMFILAQVYIFSQKRFILIQAIILLIAIVLSRIIVYPLNGGDTWAHLHNAELVAAHQNVRAIQDAYRDYPLYPTLIALFSLISNAEGDSIARLINVFTSVLSTLILYTLARKFFPSFQSSIFILLLIGAKWFAYWSTLVVAMTVAVAFFCLVMNILLGRLKGGLRVADIGVLIFVAIMIPFFHPVVAVSIVFLFLGFYIIERWILRDNKNNHRSKSLIGLTFLVFTVIVVNWMYLGEYIFDRTIISLFDAVMRDGELAVQMASGRRSPISALLDDINFYFLLAMAIIELISQVRTKSEKINIYTGLIGLAFIGFGYTTQLFAFKTAVPDRWFLFGTLLLVFPASSTFSNLFRRDTSWRRLVAVTVMMVYFFTGLANNQINKDRPLYEGNISYQSSITLSQYDGMVAIQKTLNNRDVKVKTDSWLWNYLQYVPGGDQVQYWTDKADVAQLDGIFAYRPEYRDASYFGYSNMANLTSSMTAEREYISQFYDSGDLQWIEHVSDEKLKH